MSDTRYVCSRCSEFVRGPLDIGHLCPDKRRPHPVPEKGAVVAVCNPDSAFFGRIAQVMDVSDRTVFLRFVPSTPDGLAFPFGASEVVALAPGELQEMFGR